MQRDYSADVHIVAFIGLKTPLLVPLYDDSVELSRPEGNAVSEKTIAVDAWEALFRAQVTVMRQLSAEFPTGQLSLNEYDVLFTLSTQPERRLRLKDLNQHVLLTQPSVSRLIDRLHARELVTKIADPGDGRGIIVELTEAGFNLFRRVATRHMESIAGHLNTALSPDELIRLTELSDKLRCGVTSGVSHRPHQQQG